MSPYDYIRDAIRLFEVRSVLDIVLIALFIYGSLLLLRNTTAMQVLRGIGLVFIAVLLLARTLDLVVVNWLIERSVTGVLIAMLIIFQPELRRALERVGRTGVRAWAPRPTYDGVIEPLVAVCLNLAALRRGALIVAERNTGLRDYIETGVQLDAAFSRELMEVLFSTQSPLHDGAAILHQNRVVAAACTLPLTESAVPRHAGTRHRAALGVAERTDAVAIVVSEETGSISIASDGRIVTDIDEVRLRAILNTLVGSGIRGRRGDDGLSRPWDGSRHSAAS